LSPTPDTPISSILLVIVASVFGSFGMVFFKAGAASVTGGLRSLIFNWRVIAGITLYGLSSVFFVLAMKHGQLSILYPLVSLGTVWTLLWARLFFGEPLTKMKFAAVGLIVAGIIFLNLGR
jgi:multidrug transporter EmrE-like cation transporter